jgi:hypothetical protein
LGGANYNSLKMHPWFENLDWVFYKFNLGFIKIKESIGASI